MQKNMGPLDLQTQTFLNVQISSFYNKIVFKILFKNSLQPARTQLYVFYKLNKVAGLHLEMDTIDSFKAIILYLYKAYLQIHI